MNPLVDVIVLTWNDGACLHTAVESALAGQIDGVRVIVVDNGSEPAAEVGAHERVRLIRNEHNRGVAAARNQGAVTGDAPFVMFLDSDARLHPGAVAAMLVAFDDPAVGLVAPSFTGQPSEASAGRAPTLARKVARGLNLTAAYGATPLVPGAASRRVDFAIGACQMFRRVAFDAVGGLDETYFYGPEDVDFCLRLKDAGWQVVQLVAAVCDHPPRRRHKKLLSAGGRRHARAVLTHFRHRRAVARRAEAVL
jgi:GT2 family glycosyltransferase